MASVSPSDPGRIDLSAVKRRVDPLHLPERSGNTMSASERYRQLAARQRIMARGEALPNRKAVLIASADKWMFLAEVAAAQAETDRRRPDGIVQSAIRGD